jgi:hypothetical protein
MKVIMDMYSDKLIELQNKFPDNFYFVDLRKIIELKDWTNELHLNNEAYLKVSIEFHNKIQEVLK